MFKLLIQHLVYEKAIDILYNRIFKNFPNKPKHYKKVFVKNDMETEGSILVVMYNVHLVESLDDPDGYMAQFEYFKYCDEGHIYDWTNEINMSTAVKSPTENKWYEIRKEDITRTV